MHQHKTMTPRQERELAKKIVDTIVPFAEKHGKVTCRTQRFCEKMLLLSGSAVVLPEILNTFKVHAGRGGC